ncbi:MAG: HAMP domain-containing histidine kinase [Myxococcales bacterium]|nr:HAMP domain-containing histidine kinase [Myxococcales bacterium]
MTSPRLKLTYLVLLPALIIAACTLGYYTFLTAAQFERLGEKSIAESSLLLLQDKVDRIETQIIAADNRAFALIDLAAPASVQHWKREAEELSPSIRSLLLLDASNRIVSLATRASKREERKFRRLFVARILPKLELEGLAENRLKHLHTRHDGRNFLISYTMRWHRGQRHYLAAHHDTGYLVREVLPAVVGDEPGQPRHNVLDQDNRRVFGPSLVESGDYVVGKRFPTTLYQWRLQVAPTSAPLLEAKGRSSRVNQVALIALSLVIIFLAIGFILYAADKERRVANLKSEFIATVSHELKTPLSVIRMFGEMLLSRRVRDQSKQQEYLEIICSETERLSGLIENVLDFAALERGKRSFQFEDTDLAALARRAIETMRYRFEREGVSVTLHCESAPLRGRVDAQALNLVIINLLDNAVKYGDGSPIDVRLSSEAGEIRIEVRDRGPGIPEQHRKRVFERFFRSTTSATTGARGSGIGLAIVKRIADEHHGHVWATDAEGGGAVVGLAIPASANADPAPAQHAQAAKGDSQPPAELATSPMGRRP